MKILTCNRCQSQFDVETMQAGASFVCGKCRNVLQVPASAPVIQPAPVVRPMSAPSAAPATVVLSPDEMRRALAQARGPAAAPEPAKSGPRLPAAMEARRQQQTQVQTSTRAGGASTQPAPAPAPVAAPRPAAAPAARTAAPAAASASAGPAARSSPANSQSRATLPVPGRVSRRGRSADGNEGDDGGDEPKKPPVGLYAGIGAGALALIVVVFMMMKGGSGDANAGTDTASTDVAPPPGTGPAGTAQAGGAKPADAPPANLDEWQKYLRMNESEKIGFIASRRSEAATDLPKLKILYDWFNDARLASDPPAQKALKAVVDDALRSDANCDWANLSKGRKDVYEFLRVLQQDCAKAFQFRERDELDMAAAFEKAEKERWLDPASFSKIEAVANRIRERNKELDASPRLLRVEEKKNWLRDNPLFREFTFIYRWSDPYLVCQQYAEYTDPNEAHKNKDRINKANLMATRDAIIFTELNRHYRSLFAERFKLPELKEKDRILSAVITWNFESFRDFYRKNNNGDEPSPFIRAFYMPPEQKIFHYLGDDAFRAQDELPCAGSRVQKMSDQVTFHEGTHQLEHEYGAVFRGTPLKDGDKTVAPRKSMWWDEGLAEFMGAVEVDRDKLENLVGAKFYHNRLLLERIQQVQGNMQTVNHRDAAKKWTIAEMIQPNHNGELLQFSERLLPGRGGFMANLFYARAWGMIHFLWNYDGGKYRPKMLDYMEKVYKGEHGPEALAKVFGRTGPQDWKGFEDEYNFYWDRCLARRIGFADPVGRSRPFNTETEAPTEKYDPNATEDE